MRKNSNSTCVSWYETELVEEVLRLRLAIEGHRKGHRKPVAIPVNKDGVVV